jgi:diguanylate cyclase (GGDEF)-like protein
VTAQTAVSATHAGTDRDNRLDPLTGLPNRREFLARLGDTLIQPGRRPGSIAVLFVDLDGFRQVNRDRGHGVGDELLFSAARRIVSAIGSGDVAARSGGDEFVVMSVGLERSVDVVRLGSRILEAFDDPFELGGEQFSATVSIGVAVAADPSVRPEALVVDAEAALDRTRPGTRNLELFDDELRKRIRAQAELGSEFSDGLRSGQVTMAYQPIVDVATGAVLSVEALARWRHPTKGPISPEVFVPVAEETGSSDALLACVLQQIAQDFVAIAAADPTNGISLAFNVSARQLNSDALLDGVRELIRASGVEAGRIVVEISEAALAGGVEGHLQRITELRSLGVRISLDDFGTASTSIAQLRSLPIDQVKLDRSFVEGLGEGSADAALASGLLPMTRALQIEVVAEGIETDQQLAHLFALGYRLGQGYRFSAPALPEVVVGLLERGPLPGAAAPGSSAGAKERERFQQALVAGDAKLAETVILEAVRAGLGAMTIQTEIIGRALHWVGRELEAGRLDAADEHLAAAICERQLIAVFETLHTGEPPRFSRRVLLAAIGGAGGDENLKDAADALHSAGYETVFLGADVGTDELARATGTHHARAVCLNMPSAEGGPELADALDRLSTVAEPPLVLVGGEGAAEHLGGNGSGAISISSPQDALDALATELGREPG